MFESLFGKEKSGQSCCYGRTMTPITLKKNQEIDALKREHVIERNDMIKKFESLEEVMKFMPKENTDLDENDIEEMMKLALGNKSSAVSKLWLNCDLKLRSQFFYLRPLFSPVV